MISHEKEKTIICEKQKIKTKSGIESTEAITIILEKIKYIGGWNKYTAYEIEARGKNTYLSKALREKLKKKSRTLKAVIGEQAWIVVGELRVLKW